MTTGRLQAIGHLEQCEPLSLFEATARPAQCDSGFSIDLRARGKTAGFPHSCHRAARLPSESSELRRSRRIRNPLQICCRDRDLRERS